MKIYIHYNLTENPYGGANSFLRALKSEILKHEDFRIVESVKEKPDVFIYNSFLMGNKRININTIRNISRFGYPNYLLFSLERFKKRNVFLIHRVDGIVQLYGRMNKEEDDLQFKLNKFADHTIFQSRFCLESFKAFGYSGENHSVILNGVNQGVFNLRGKAYWDGRSRLRVLSCSWSKNLKKGFDTIAKTSELEFVESYFIGNWPEGVDAKRVKIMKPMRQGELSEEYRKCDIFLHPAQNDPCPNCVLEALSCGLPVLHDRSGGTPEIVNGKYGTEVKSDLKLVFEEVRKRFYDWVDNIRRDLPMFSINRAAREYLETIRELRISREL